MSEKGPGVSEGQNQYEDSFDKLTMYTLRICMLSKVVGYQHSLINVVLTCLGLHQII